jgi:uncharacterized radical SAM superfamily Fe-S cluster-containing enzyme
VVFVFDLNSIGREWFSVPSSTLHSKKSIVSSSYGSALPYSTRSICPECKRVLPARVYSKSNKVFLKRSCPEHGVFDEVYWESVSEFNRARRFAKNGTGVSTFNVSLTKNDGSNCPFDCGLCTNHQNHTALANIALTNRCDLSCWYCFFYVKEGQPIYEPSLEQIDRMLLSLRAQKPLPANAIQFTGGEPTLRKDLLDIIRLAKKRGFNHIQLNTHGINFASNPGLAEKVFKAGVSTIYLSFDGVSPKTNPKNHYEVPRILSECKKAGLAVVLVPTLIKGVNEHEVGAIIDFALRNIDVVRGVNFQPISFVGRMPKTLRAKQRITIPKALELIEKQTKGALSKKDFFAVPCVSSLNKFIEQSTSSPQYSLNTHFACGAATYLFEEDGKIISLPSFFDVNSFFSLLEKKSSNIERAFKLARGPITFIEASKLLFELTKLVDSSRAPKRINLPKLIVDFLVLHNYSSLVNFHVRTLFIGMMHFMDLYNYDQQRVERCQVHYAMPDGRLIPFCAFNVVPELYRDKVQPQFSVSWREWQKQHPHENLYYKYTRDEKALSSEKIYSQVYSKTHSSKVRK